MYATNKSSDIKRHVARMYIKTVSDRRDSEIDWERQDPGPVIDILGPLSDLEQDVMSETPQKSPNELLQSTEQISQKDPAVIFAKLLCLITTDPEVGSH